MGGCAGSKPKIDPPPKSSHQVKVGGTLEAENPVLERSGSKESHSDDGVLDPDRVNEVQQDGGPGGDKKKKKKKEPSKGGVVRDNEQSYRKRKESAENVAAGEMGSPKVDGGGSSAGRGGGAGAAVTNLGQSSAKKNLTVDSTPRDENGRPYKTPPASPGGGQGRLDEQGSPMKQTAPYYRPLIRYANHEEIRQGTSIGMTAPYEDNVEIELEPAP